MSTVSALKFLPEFMGQKRNTFAEGEREVRQALKNYLRRCVTIVNWQAEGQPIIAFVNQVKWDRDVVLTFNYDMLLERAMKIAGVAAGDRVLHLHGSIGERTLAYPTYKKLAYKNTRSTLAKRWKDAFSHLRNLGRADRLIFIGYSMPPSDFEAKGLFNYTDWYNAYDSAGSYSYQILLVNKDPTVVGNYSFLRRPPGLRVETFASWISCGEVSKAT